METVGTKSNSVQARLDQLEHAIAEAHGHTDKMVPSDTKPTEQPSASGIEPSLSRCEDEMVRLNTKLSNLAARLGTL